MTSDQVRDLIIVLCLLGPIIVFLIYTSISLNKRYVNEAIENIQKYIDLNSESNVDVVIYTAGHPYVWSEISKIELEKSIKNNSWMPSTAFTGIPVPKRPKYLLNYNRDKNSVHIVFTLKKSFDWESLKFYDDYVNKP